MSLHKVRYRPCVARRGLPPGLIWPACLPFSRWVLRGGSSDYVHASDTSITRTCLSPPRTRAFAPPGGPIVFSDHRLMYRTMTPLFSLRNRPALAMVRLSPFFSLDLIPGQLFYWTDFGCQWPCASPPPFPFTLRLPTARVAFVFFPPPTLC